MKPGKSQVFTSLSLLTGYFSVAKGDKDTISHSLSKKTSDKFRVSCCSGFSLARLRVPELSQGSRAREGLA